MKYDIRIIAVMLLALLAAGCATDGVGVQSLTPVCTGLVGPIHYNSKDKASQRYAASLLVKDLKVRNQVGVRLGCPSYKTK